MEDLNLSEARRRIRSEDAFERIAESLMQIQQALSAQAAKLQELDERIKNFDSSVQMALKVRKISPDVSSTIHFTSTDTKYNSTADTKLLTGGHSESANTQVSDINGGTRPLNDTLKTALPHFSSNQQTNASISLPSSSESSGVIFNSLTPNSIFTSSSLPSAPSSSSPHLPDQFSSSASNEHRHYSTSEFPSSLPSATKSNITFSSNKSSVTLRDTEYFDNHGNISFIGEDLLTASFKGKLEEVRKLLESGADINDCDQCGKTSLHMAAGKAHYDVVCLLLRNGAKVNSIDKFGNSALFSAAYNDHSGQCVSLLIAAGADVHRVNTNGFTPLHLAAISGNEAGVQALVRAGASKASKDNSGRTPFDCAQENCVRVILRPVSTCTRAG